jgi:hypothetical protein
MRFPPVLRTTPGCPISRYQRATSNAAPTLIDAVTSNALHFLLSLVVPLLELIRWFPSLIRMWQDHPVKRHRQTGPGHHRGHYPAQPQTHDGEDVPKQLRLRLLPAKTLAQLDRQGDSPVPGPAGSLVRPQRQREERSSSLVSFLCCRHAWWTDSASFRSSS